MTRVVHLRDLQHWVAKSLELYRVAKERIQIITDA